jgi:hypothetical protein
LNKIQQAGETGRSAGYGFEDLILNEINCNLNGKIAQQIVTTIAKDKKINLNNFNICAEKMPSKVIDRFDNSKKTSPKADIRINFKNQNEHFRFGISIKSSNISIQVQITNIDNFKIACENKNLEFSDLLYISLSKFCGFGEYKPTKEEQKTLKQGDRNRWLIQELEENEQKEIELFFNQNQEEITKLVLKEGTALEEFFADYYLVNNSKFSATGKVDFCIKNIDEVIQNSIQKSCYKVTDKGSFHIGSVTVQMKGSGKGEAYHGFQFNKSGC